MSVPSRIRSMQSRRSVLLRYKRHDEADAIERDVAYLRTYDLIDNALTLPAPLTARQRAALIALLSFGETGGGGDLAEAGHGVLG